VSKQNAAISIEFYPYPFFKAVPRLKAGFPPESTFGISHGKIRWWIQGKTETLKHADKAGIFKR
jgi:hypothetical protein